MAAIAMDEMDGNQTANGVLYDKDKIGTILFMDSCPEFVASQGTKM